MKVYRSVEELASSRAPSAGGRVVATIGNFDGVHCGHRWVIAEVIARARALSANSHGVGSLAITFEPHPARVLRPERIRPLITPLAEKLEQLAATGIGAALVLPFDEGFSKRTARWFADEVLRRGVGAVEVHEGENFRFGHQAEAGIDGLEALGREFGFGVHIYAPRMLRGEIVSSSRIRQLVAAGDLHTARALLGRPFAVRSTPASGRGFGTRYTVPTINLAAYTELLPAHGVYVTTLRVGEGAAAECFDAVTNVGNRPTFGEDSFTVESHLLNFHPIALTAETPLELTFLARLREERRWPTPEALRKQIGIDVRRARRYFSLCKVVGVRLPGGLNVPEQAKRL